MGYLGNRKLISGGEQIQLSVDQFVEMQRCMEDVEYFCENYVKIVNVDKGLINFDLYEYQRRLMNLAVRERFSICKLPRQTGKTTTVVALLLWYVLFHEHFSVAILAHKAEQSREILSRLKLAYEHLPKWMQQGIVEWNKGSIELENGSTIIAAATASSAIRGTSQNLVYLDEFAHVPANIQEDFFSSVYPTISSGQTTKVLITSTPNGLNMFYKLWVDSEEGRNSYKRLEIHWSETPGRDEAWKLETIRNTSERQFAQEFECEFLGSTNTLIHPAVLRRLAFRTPEMDNQAGLRVYKQKQDGHSYVITVDTSRGVGIDYSAYVVFDITAMPYDIVATYRNDEIQPYLYPNLIEQTAKYFNGAWVLVETNDLGQQVSDILFRELEYENVFSTTAKGRAGVQLSSGFSPTSVLGVRTTKLVKRIGCSNLKSLVEGDKLLIPDFNIIQELATFSANNKGSYEAEEGHHDDLVMCCVLFAWLNDQNLMRDLSNIDVRSVIYNDRSKEMEEQLLPFGIIDQGTTQEEEQQVVLAVRSDDDAWMFNDANESYFQS